jgi:hypothetical protein
MQETRVNKVSRRFYIDHADDHAVIRSVEVAKDVQPRLTSNSPQVSDSNSTSEVSRERRLSKLVNSTVRRPRLRPHRKNA